MNTRQPNTPKQVQQYKDNIFPFLSPYHYLTLKYDNLFHIVIFNCFGLPGKNEWIQGFFSDEISRIQFRSEARNYPAIPEIKLLLLMHHDFK